MAAVLKALEISFSKAKSKGLKVMVSTSYLSPYNAYDDVAYNKRAQELWRGILANKDFDIFSPQFYNDGKTAGIHKSWGMSDLTLTIGRARSQGCEDSPHPQGKRLWFSTTRATSAQ